MYPACSRSGNCRCPWDGLVQALTYTRTRQVGWLALWHGDCVVVGTVGHCRRRSCCQRSAVGGRSWPPVVNRGHHRRRSPSSVVVIVACFSFLFGHSHARRLCTFLLRISSAGLQLATLLLPAEPLLLSLLLCRPDCVVFAQSVANAVVFGEKRWFVCPPGSNLNVRSCCRI